MQYGVVLEGVHGFVYTLLAFSFRTFFLGIFLASRKAGRRKKSNKITSNYLRLYKNPNQNTGNTRPIPYKIYTYIYTYKHTHTKILKRNAHILAGIFV